MNSNRVHREQYRLFPSDGVYWYLQIKFKLSLSKKYLLCIAHHSAHYFKNFALQNVVFSSFTQVQLLWAAKRIQEGQIIKTGGIILEFHFVKWWRQ